MAFPDPAELAAVAAALGAGALLLADRRSTLLVGFALVASAEVGFAAALLGGDIVDRLIGPAVAAALVAGLAVIGGIAAVLARYPAVVAPLVVVAAPFRLPLDIDPDHRFFVARADPGALGRLLPLYIVLAAATLAFLLRLLRTADVKVLPRYLTLPAAGFIGFASLSLLWSQDPDAAANRLAFFILPFVALVGVVGRMPFADWLPRVLAITSVALALVFAAVALWQAATHRLLFFAPSVELANEYGSIFRVTSLFRDPSLYGRHVVLAIAVLLVLAFLHRVHLAVAVGLIAILWAGLYFSYSQSSLAALFAVAFGIAALGATARARRLILVAAGAIVLAGAIAVGVQARDDSVQRVTSDRSRRVELAAQVFADRPIAGVGLAAQQRASQALDDRPAPVTNYVSHTTPLTIAAELGLIGLALYIAVLAGAVRLVQVVRRDSPALGLSLGAVLLALFVHALFYSGFFEDPITWTALAIGASFVAESAFARERAPVLRRADPAPGTS